MTRARGSEEYEGIVALIPPDFSNPDDSLAEIRAKFDFVHGQPVGDGVVVEEHPSDSGSDPKPGTTTASCCSPTRVGS